MNNLFSNCKRSILFFSLVISTFQLSAQFVWPGDVNQNGIVSQVDLLYTGWAYGAEGEPREIQGSAWESYSVPPIEWDNQFPDGSNFYYADANGDGTVNDTDIDVITTLNYNQTNSIPEPEGYLNAPPGSQHPALYLDVISSEVLLGEPIQIDLYLGDADIPVDDFHGIALDINYDSEHNSTFSSVDYNEDPTSWVQPGSEYFDFVYHEDGEKNIDLALSRLSGSTIDGQGKLGSFIIIVEDIVLGVGSDTINFTIDNVKFVGADFETFPVIPASTQFVVRRPDCNVEITYEEHSCASFTFFEENQIELHWTVNGENTGPASGSPAIDFDPSEAGTYEICGYYETVDCPGGPFACETIVVSPDCFGDCAVGIIINEIDCDTYEIFESSEQQVSWFINDEFVSFYHGIDFDPTEAGTYEICAGIETPDCPQGVFVCETIVVGPDCFENECEFNVQITQQSCSGYNLFSTEQEQLDWYINEEFQLTGIAYDFYPDTPGTYEICVVNEGCSPATNFCETFVVTEDCLEDECEFNVQINQQSCSGYNLFSTEQEQLDWYINEEFQLTGIAYDFYPDTPGTYEICVVNEGCPPATNFCETFVVTEDCLEDECEFNVQINQQSCSEYNLFSTAQEQLDWYINEEFQLTGIAYDFYPDTPGTYEICVVNEGCSPATNFCETFVITEDCFETVNVDETLQDQEIIIRPTITNSDFHIDGLSGKCIIEIFNQNGKLVFQKIINGDLETSCDISNLLPGLYYISILNSENKFKRIKKILKM